MLYYALIFFIVALIAAVFGFTGIAGGAAAVAKITDAVRALGGESVEVIESPITGAEGNREFLLHAVVTE